jgi:hypothetical protein
MANYSVVKNPQGGWDAKKDNAQKSSFHGDTQKEAEKAAKQFSSNNGGGEVRIHGLNGKIIDSDTVAPGNDPSSIKDRKH